LVRPTAKPIVAGSNPAWPIYLFDFNSRDKCFYDSLKTLFSIFFRFFSHSVIKSSGDSASGFQIFPKPI